MSCASLIMLSASPWHAAAVSRLLTGATTAREAAAPETLLESLPAPPMDSNNRFFSAQPDSTDQAGGYFEEEEEAKHLYRDIGVFLIISAFVGYFIVEVFLRGETEEPPADDGGKDVPIPFAFKLIF